MQSHGHFYRRLRPPLPQCRLAGTEVTNVIAGLPLALPLTLLLLLLLLLVVVGS